MSDRAILRGNSFQNYRAKNNLSWHCAFTCGSDDSQNGRGLVGTSVNMALVALNVDWFAGGPFPSKFNSPDDSVLMEGNSGEETASTATSEIFKMFDAGNLSKGRAVGFCHGEKCVQSKWWKVVNLGLGRRGSCSRRRTPECKHLPSPKSRYDRVLIYKLIVQ